MFVVGGIQGEESPRRPPHHHRPPTNPPAPKAVRKAVGDSGAPLAIIECSLLDDVGDNAGFSRFFLDLHMMR